LVSPDCVTDCRRPGAAQQVAGTVDGTLPSANLATPDELSRTSASRPRSSDGKPLGGFGMSYNRRPAGLQDLRMLELMLAVFVMLRFGLFSWPLQPVSAATRLPQPGRYPLIGSRAAKCGRLTRWRPRSRRCRAVARLLAYIGAERAFALRGRPPGWFPQDAMPSVFTSTLCVARPCRCAPRGWPASDAAAADSPLEVRRDAAESPSIWRIVPLALGLAQLTGFWLTGTAARRPARHPPRWLLAGILSPVRLRRGLPDRGPCAGRGQRP